MGPDLDRGAPNIDEPAIYLEMVVAPGQVPVPWAGALLKVQPDVPVGDIDLGREYPTGAVSRAVDGLVPQIPKQVSRAQKPAVEVILQILGASPARGCTQNDKKTE